jgi:hypothetical protein
VPLSVVPLVEFADAVDVAVTGDVDVCVVDDGDTLGNVGAVVALVVGKVPLLGDVVPGICGPSFAPRPSMRGLLVLLAVKTPGPRRATAATAAVVMPPMAIGAGRRGLKGLRLVRWRGRYGASPGLEPLAPR